MPGTVATAGSLGAFTLVASMQGSSLGFLQREGASTGAAALDMRLTFPNFGLISSPFRAC